MRNSRQRDTILKIVRESDDHPTADMVYTRARMHIDNISLGTVYRNLNLLSEQGLIKKFKIIGDNERFDKTVIMHSHFVSFSTKGTYKRLRRFSYSLVNIQQKQ